jgi:hypothetical protein
MSIPLSLADNDLRAVKSWFSSQTASKILVFCGFAGVFLAIAGGLFYGSLWVFTLLAPLKTYGWFTAEYLIRAAILIIFWLGVGSGTAAAINTFYSRNSNFDWLLTLPVGTKTLAGWYFGKTVLINAVLLFIFIFPLTAAFAWAFWGNISLIFALKAGLLILALAVITNSAGGVIAALVLKSSRKRSLATTIGLVAGFLLVLIMIFALVFPADLMQMTLAGPDQFSGIYNRLPLSNRALPTSFFAAIITEGSVSSLFLTVIFVLAVSVPYIIWLGHNFTGLFQLTGEKLMTPIPAADKKAGRNPEIHFDSISPNILLAEKDLVSIIRSPAEAGYGLFLLLLVVSFFGLFSRIKPDAAGQIEWINRLIVFSFLGFAFFANTYFLRLVFPLMAREGESAWYLFTMPVSRIKILSQKLLLALAVSYPLIFLAISVWWILPFAYPYQLLLAVSSLWMVLVLPVVHSFSGAIYPDFALGNDPEKVSTSSMGILTVIIGLGLALIFALGLYKYINGGLDIPGVVAIYIFATAVTVFITGLISTNFIRRYEF